MDPRRQQTKQSSGRRETQRRSTNTQAICFAPCPRVALINLRSSTTRQIACPLTQDSSVDPTLAKESAKEHGLDRDGSACDKPPCAAWASNAVNPSTQTVSVTVPLFNRQAASMTSCVISLRRPGWCGVATRGEPSVRSRACAAPRCS